MKYYKNSSDKIYADPLEKTIKKEGLIEITETEKDSILAPTSEELLAQAKANFISMTDTHIQAEVDKYNEANNVMFASVHNCSTYITVDTYPHQAFCIAIINWNAEVWETIRAITTLPTDEEFQAILDGVVFAG